MTCASLNTNTSPPELTGIRLAGICLLLLCLPSVPAAAQYGSGSSLHSSDPEQKYEQEGPASSFDHTRPPGTGLPSAFEPSSPPSTLGSSRPSATPGVGQPSSAPALPGNPDQVPVDGGLGWLAAAGAAYAARRLYKDSSSDDSDGRG